MGSFNSKAASKQHPITMNSPKRDKTNKEQRKDGESEKNMEKCTKSDGDMAANQNPVAEDACTTKRSASQCKITSKPKRQSNVASYLWLASSPIIQDEESLMNESVAPCTASLPSPCQWNTDESVKSERFRPPFYSYPTFGTCTKTWPSNGEKHSPPIRTARNKVTQRSKASSSSADKTALNRSIGFGVDKNF